MITAISKPRGTLLGSVAAAQNGYFSAEHISNEQTDISREHSRLFCFVWRVSFAFPTLFFFLGREGEGGTCCFKAKSALP